MLKGIIEKIKGKFSERCEFYDSCKYYDQSNENCERQRSGDMIICGTRRNRYLDE